MARVKITSSPSGGVKRPVKKPHGLRIRRRTRPGLKALREIQYFQKTAHLLICRLPFVRLVREIGTDYKRDLLWGEGAILALQEAAEAYIGRILEVADELASHSNHKTLDACDIRLAVHLQTVLRGD